MIGKPPAAAPPAPSRTKLRRDRLPHDRRGRNRMVWGGRVTAGRSSSRVGVAYFGVRDLDHAAVDLERMVAEGIAWVLLPFTHDDARWEVTTFAALVERSHRLGLETVISPWGGAEFGGEGVQTDLPLAEWLTAARDTGAQSLHVDEPKVVGTSLERVLDIWGDDEKAWLTLQPDRAAAVPRAVIERVAVLGTDSYNGAVATRVAETRAFAAAAGRLDLAWVQAFRIPAGEEPLVGEAVRAMAALAPRVGVWGWKGSTGRGVLRSANPEAVQAAVAAAIAAITE